MCVILIPAYEPNENLIKLVREIKSKCDYKILIIDDGSGEKYQEIFKEVEKIGCILVAHEINRGKGAALKTGFKYLRDNFKANFKELKIVCADSDGQHCVSDIMLIAENISQNVMTLGVREFNKAEKKVPFKSRFGNNISAGLFKLASGINLKDTQTGLRGYFGTVELFDWLIAQKGERFEYELNLLLEAKSANIAIKQIEIRTIYENNNKGTHFRPLVDSLKVIAPIFNFFLKFLISSFSAGVLDFGLLFLFEFLTESRFFSVVFARIISASYNYCVNRFVVFKAKNKQSVVKYFSLAGAIMLLNYLLLTFFADVAGNAEPVAKILTEIILFSASYICQRLFVFGKN